MWLGQTCNIRCHFCYFLDRINATDHPEHPFMTIDKAKQICSTLVDFYGNNAIDIQGGEPTLYRHINELVEHCRKIGLLPTLITNAIGPRAAGIRPRPRPRRITDGSEGLRPDPARRRAEWLHHRPEERLGWRSRQCTQRRAAHVSGGSRRIVGRDGACGPLYKLVPCDRKVPSETTPWRWVQTYSSRQSARACWNTCS